jgi:hypothetical protein
VLNKIWKDPVWSKVIAAGIIAALAAVSGYFLGWWPRLISLAKKMWQFMLSTTPLPNWLIGILIIGTTGALSILIILFKATSSKNVTLKTYNDDIFFNIHWRWNCDSFGGIHNLSSFCPTCDYQIYPRNIVGYAAAGDHIVYLCEECKETIHDFNVGQSVVAIEDRVIRLIQKKLRSIEDK